MRALAVSDLLAMLCAMRPHGSKEERNFCRKWLAPLGAATDSVGNYILQIGESDILWASHTDTVHFSGGKQKISIDKDGIIKLAPDSSSNCLGADCTIGVWIMREMILNRIPGLYIFHAGEECGGIGSRHVAMKTPKILAGIKIAVAFDRKGATSIITHQSGRRCCSDVFAESLAQQLQGYTRDKTGIFTDTAHYVDLVDECTNVSVGYSDEHSIFESADLNAARNLLEKLLALNPLELICSRIAGGFKSDAFDNYGGYFGRTYEEVDLAQLCSDYPEIAAKFLYENHITSRDFSSVIDEQMDNSLAYHDNWK